MTPRQILDKPWSGERLLTLVVSILAIGGALGSFASIAAAKIGVSLSGNPELVATVESRIRVDSLYTHQRISANQQLLQNLEERTQHLERVVEIWTYIQCADMRRHDPAATPRTCQDVLAQ